MPNLPPPPKLPPTGTKKILNKNHCAIHKGPLSGDIYICEQCGAKMCKSCAIKRKYEENKSHCPKCTGFLFVKKDD